MLSCRPSCWRTSAASLEDGVLQRPAVGPGLLRLVHRPAELLVDHPLDAFSIATTRDVRPVSRLSRCEIAASLTPKRREASAWV